MNWNLFKIKKCCFFVGFRLICTQFPKEKFVGSIRTQITLLTKRQVFYLYSLKFILLCRYDTSFAINKKKKIYINVCSTINFKSSILLNVFDQRVLRMVIFLGWNSNFLIIIIYQTSLLKKWFLKIRMKTKSLFFY